MVRKDVCNVNTVAGVMAAYLAGWKWRFVTLWQNNGTSVFLLRQFQCASIVPDWIQIGMNAWLSNHNIYKPRPNIHLETETWHTFTMNSLHPPCLICSSYMRVPVRSIIRNKSARYAEPSCNRRKHPCVIIQRLIVPMVRWHLAPSFHPSSSCRHIARWMSHLRWTC